MSSTHSSKTKTNDSINHSKHKPRHLKFCQTYAMTDSDGDLFSEDARESALDQYSSFLDIQLEVLEDSGDLDYSEKQFLERNELTFIGDEDLESAIAHDEAIAKIAYGRISESEKLKLASQFGITATEVYEYQFATVSDFDELDELEIREIENEQYLLDRETYGYENY